MSKKKISKANNQSPSVLSYIVIAVIGLAGGYKYNEYQDSKILLAKSAEQIELQKIAQASSRSKEEIIEDIKKARPFLQKTFSAVFFPIIQNEMLDENSEIIREIIKYPNFWADLSKEHTKEEEELNQKYSNLTVNFYKQFSAFELEEYVQILNDPNFVKISQSIEGDLRTIASHELSELKIEYYADIKEFTVNYLEKNVPKKN